MSEILDSFNTLFEGIFEPAVLIDSKRKILGFNNSLVTISHCPPRVLRKKPDFCEIIKSFDVDVKALVDKAILNQTTLISKEISIQFYNQEEPAGHYVFKVNPIVAEGKVLFIVCINDMSVERSLYDKYKEQLKQLKDNHKLIVQADKMATLGELTASISHEINNPLTIASGNTEILELSLEDMPPSEALTDASVALENIQESLMRINTIIKDMRNYLHGKDDERKYTKIADVFETSKKFLHPLFEKSGVKLSSTMDDETTVCLINRSRIEQVLVNLGKNALDAITANEGQETGEVLFRSCIDHENNNICISVKDNGPGIPEDVRNNIFEAFFTTKDIGSGTGLGLSICSKIVESHDGELTVENSPEGGAVFTMTIPVMEISSLANNNSGWGSLTTEEDRRILVLDNEPEILNLMNKIIQSEGHSFVGSNDGEEALRLLGKMSFDLIITDYNMPKMNGDEFSRMVRDRGISAPILYMSSEDNIENYDKDKDELNICGMVLKPFNRDKISSTLNAILGTKDDHGE